VINFGNYNAKLGTTIAATLKLLGFSAIERDRVRQSYGKAARAHRNSGRANKVALEAASDYALDPDTTLHVLTHKTNLK
jgi:hypothetical protein